MMIVFHQSHETNHKIETLFFSYGFIISGVCYHNKKKNHSIFTLKANYKPQFKNCKLSISIVCNFWLHNNLTNSFLYPQVILTKLPEYLHNGYYELDTIVNTTFLYGYNSARALIRCWESIIFL